MPRASSSRKSSQRSRARNQNRADANSGQLPAELRPRQLTARQLEEISVVANNVLGHGRTAKDFQLQAIQNQEARRDTVVHAPTGSGKTFIIGAPLRLPSNAGRVTLVCSPLIGLQNEMVQTFKEEYGLPSVAIC